VIPERTFILHFNPAFPKIT